MQRRKVGEGAIRRSRTGVPGAGQLKPDQLEIDRLQREVSKLKAERDIL